MYTRLLCLLAGSLIGLNTLTAQCLDAFPSRVQMYTCGNVEDLCVEQFPDQLTYYWFGAPDTNCVETPTAGARSIRIQDPGSACDYGPDPKIVISGAMGISLAAQNPSACVQNDGWIDIQIDLTDTVFYRLSSLEGLIATDTLVLDSLRFNNLSVGDYQLNIWRLGGGCSTNLSYDLQAPEANGLDVEIQGDPFICFNNLLPLEAIINGGNPPFSYAWSTGDSTSAAIWPNNEGMHSVTVTDNAGCTDVADFYVEFAPFYWIDANITDASCDGTATGSIELVLQGDLELENLELFWNDLNGEGPINRYDLPPGNYQLTTSSVFGCQEFWSFTVGQSSDLEISFISPNPGVFTNMICFGGSYQINPQINGGQPPYNFLWSDGSTENSLTANQEGTYSVTITDSGICQTTSSITLYYPNWNLNNININQPNCGLENGNIDIGLNTDDNFSIDWNTGNSGAQIENLGAGNYTATLSYVGICDTSITFDLNNQLLELEILNPLSDTMDCYVPDRRLTSSITGPQYSYAWTRTGGDTISTDSSVLVFTNSTYRLLIEDSETGCTYEASRTMYRRTHPPVANITFEEFISCETPARLTLPENTSESLEFEISFPDGNVYPFIDPVFVLPQVGTYFVYVTSIERGCTNTYSFTVADTGIDCGSIQGALFLTEDCNNPSNGTLVSNYLVRLTPQNSNVDPTIVSTNGIGQWTAQLTAGEYLVEALPYNDALYAPCPPTSISLETNEVITAVNLGMTALVDCASPRVDVNIPFLRRCFNNPIYITYCNDGPEPLLDAQLVVELDSFLYYQSSTTIPENVDAFTLTYNLGDLPAFACGNITIYAIVSCQATIGQNHCVLAQIPTAAPCPEPDNWSGATVGLSADCDEDELEFKVTNIGIADMTVNLQYVIVEDGLMLNPTPIELPPLQSGQDIFIPVPANGSTYHLITNQEPNSPGAPIPTLAVEGCGTNEFGTFSLYYLNQLSLADEELNNLDLECQNNQGAYDPNDKAALPIGYGPSHFISPNQSIEYTIRFQNTGTDTAFQVVLRDTLAPELDLSTFRAGATSHDYNFLIDSNRVLEVSFPDIMLPDSFVAPLASQGAFQFSIRPADNLPRGTRIENSAGIYFDFNEPVLTNTVFHTINKDFIDIINSLDSPIAAEASFLIYPNPASNFISWNWSVSPPFNSSFYRLDIYSSIGQLVRQYSAIQPAEDINISGLAAGLYYLHINTASGQSLGLQALQIE